MALKSKWPDVEIPENLSWSQYVLQNADKYSDRTAIVDSNSEKSYTYKELKDLVRKFGSGLTKKGFKKGDILAMVCPNIPDFPVLYFGVISIGGIVTTMNPLYTVEEASHQLKDSAAKWIVTLPQFADKVKEAAAKVGVENIIVIGEAEGCQSYSELLDAADDVIVEVDINPKEDLAALPYSSGTTGLPKGVMLTHYNLIADSCITIGDDFYHCNEESSSLAVLPLFHSFSLMINLANVFVRGGKVVCLVRFEPEPFLKAIQDHKITNTSLVPPIILFMTKHPMVEQYDLSSLVDITCGAAPMGEELGKQLVERLPNLKWLRQGYGMTELCPVSHVTPLGKSTSYGSVGVLLPNLECKVVDTVSGETLPKASDGEICVRGPIVMKGYLNNEAATAHTIDKEGWYHTGDIGHYDEDENFYIVDRLKELIKYKGLQVAPAELEAILLTHPEVPDAAVIGIPDEECCELPKAFVVRKGDVTEEALADFVHEKVAPYKKLRGGIVFIEKIPKSASGKILRRELKEKELVQSPQLQEIAQKRDVNVLRSKYPDVEIPDNMSWTEFVMKDFDSFGDKLALTDVKRERFYTYRQLKDLITRTSSALIKIGMKKGDVLCLYCPNIPEFAIIYLATIHVGGVVTTANPLYTEDELAHQLQLANAKYLVTTPQIAHRARESAQKNGITQLYVVGKAEGFMAISILFEDDGSSFQKGNINPKEDTALLPFSSGTTGLPKGVQLTHYNLVSDASIASAEGFIGYSTSSVLLGFLPFFHTYGLVTVLSVGLRCGSTIVCVPKFERDHFFSILQGHKVTHVALVPSVAMMVAKDPSLQSYDLSSLSEITSGAAVLGGEVSKEVLKRLPHLKGMRQGYGMTELSPVSHMTVMSSTKHGTVGHLLPNLECKVIDLTTGETVGAGIDGEICVRGPVVMKGYLDNSEATSNTIDQDSWLHTGDIGHYDRDECFYIVDRVKELIKYKGYQVPPAELESLLVSHPEITDAAVIGIPDNEAGELPMAYVVTNGNISKDDIIKFVEENVAPYKKLRGGVEFVDEIPRSLSGKILRRELKDKPKLLRAAQSREPSSSSRRKRNSTTQPVQTKSSCCSIL